MALTKVVYSDTLMLSDFEKWERLAMLHFGDIGQDFNRYPLTKIEDFLKDWYGIDLELLHISQEQNMGTGFPVYALKFLVSVEKENQFDPATFDHSLVRTYNAKGCEGCGEGMALLKSGTFQCPSCGGYSTAFGGFWTWDSRKML